MNSSAIVVMGGAAWMCSGLFDLDYLQHVLVGLPWEGSYAELWQQPALKWGFTLVLLGIGGLVAGVLGWFFLAGDEVYWWNLEQRARKAASELVRDPTDLLVLRTALLLEADGDGWRPETVVRYLDQLPDGPLSAEDDELIRHLLADVQAKFAEVDEVLRASRSPHRETYRLGGRAYPLMDLLDRLGKAKAAIRTVRGYQGQDPTGTPSPVSRR